MASKVIFVAVGSNVLAGKQEIRGAATFMPSTVKRTRLFRIMDQFQILNIHPTFHCFSIFICFTIAPVCVVAIKVIHYDFSRLMTRRAFACKRRIRWFIYAFPCKAFQVVGKDFHVVVTVNIGVVDI